MSFVTGKGSNHQVIKLRPIVQTLGQAKTVALPTFHAFSGADNTGSFSGKGKLAWWKIFQEADEDVLTELGRLGVNENPTAKTETAIDKLVCQLYLPKTTITEVKERRWWLFRKKQAQSERLLPTQAALHETILRVHYQLMVWNNDRARNPQLPPPQNYGWKRKGEKWLPVLTKLPPAPEAIFQLVKCTCTKERCSTNRCQCHKAWGLNCTDLCTCSDGEPCDNVCSDDDHLETDDDDDDDVKDGEGDLQ